MDSRPKTTGDRSERRRGYLTSLTRFFSVGANRRMPRSYSIYMAKAKLSEVLRSVKKGNEIVVTERGHPIARIVPYREMTLDERLEALKRSGHLIERTSRKWPSSVGVKRPGALKRFLADRNRF